MQESLLSKLLHCPNDYFSSWTGGIVKLAFLTDKAKKCKIPMQQFSGNQNSQCGLQIPHAGQKRQLTLITT